MAIFVSGSGTNAEEIMNYFAERKTAQVVTLLSNNPGAYALERAKKHNVPVKVFDRRTFYHSEEVLDYLKREQVTHIVLAGFLWLVPDYLIAHYPHRIVNIHPALLPRYGGKGMYGMRVHEAVKENGETESGITIHEVNEHYDEGAILFQARVALSPTDSPEQIAEKVHSLEYKHYPRVIDEWVK